MTSLLDHINRSTDPARHVMEADDLDALRRDRAELISRVERLEAELREAKAPNAWWIFGRNNDEKPPCNGAVRETWSVSPIWRIEVSGIVGLLRLIEEVDGQNSVFVDPRTRYPSISRTDI